MKLPVEVAAIYPKLFKAKGNKCVPVSEYWRKSSLQRRKEREAAAGPGWSKSEWDDLVILFDGKCLRCGSDEKQLVPDHVIPLCDGGKHQIENIQPLCYLCNIWKNTKIVDFRPCPSPPK